jgi:hypothetical protein
LRRFWTTKIDFLAFASMSPPRETAAEPKLNPNKPLVVMF